MAGIRGSDTQPELLVRRYLHAAGLRFRLNDRLLPGRPDIVLPRYRSVVFVHGCFWHRHPGCRYATTPLARAEFWASKFALNIQRDKRVVAELEALGWTVLTFWECEMRDPANLDMLFWHIVSAGSR
ncbi:Very short patch repair protein [compost metagenome]